MPDMEENTPETEESIEEFGPIELEMAVDPSESVETPVDATLSISGVAADAKATGDAIADLSADLSALMDSVGVSVPDTNGVYVLKATVSNGTVTYEWSEA